MTELTASDTVSLSFIFVILYIFFIYDLTFQGASTCLLLPANAHVCGLNFFYLLIDNLPAGINVYLIVLKDYQMTKCPIDHN